MRSKSEMAGVLCKWVRAIEDFYKAYQIVRPKEEKLAKIKKELEEMQEKLAAMNAEYTKLMADLTMLKEREAKN